MLVIAGLPRAAAAQDDQPAFWLGLWCGDTGKLAVASFGADPVRMLKLVRNQLPEARAIVPATVRLSGPGPGQGCAVQGVGEVRVTTHNYPRVRGGSACVPWTYSAAWVGRRRVVDGPISSCAIVGLVVTASLVFECKGYVEIDAAADARPASKLDPICNPLGSPQIVGRYDDSMFPATGRRPRAGLQLSYAERTGACEPFITLEGSTGWADESVNWPLEGRFLDSRFTLVPSETGAERPRTVGIDWQFFESELKPFGDNTLAMGWLGKAAFDFLNTGQSDAVLWLHNFALNGQIELTEEYFIVIPGRGADLEAIAEQVLPVWQNNSGWFEFDGRRGGEVIRFLKDQYPLVIVHPRSVASGNPYSQYRSFMALRDHNKTYTLAFDWRGWAIGNAHASLSRVEADGRLTPVCLYDRTLAPPWSPW
jgi:hypothetical protein